LENEKVGKGGKIGHLHEIRLIPWHSIRRVHRYETTMWTFIFYEKVQLICREGIESTSTSYFFCVSAMVMAIAGQ
jgi:hypothetical protein